MTKKILILEDEKPLARALELKFEREGFEAMGMTSGEGLLDVLSKENISLIVCDLVMPKVDGFEVLKLMKGKKIPIVILTNLSQEEDEKLVKDMGAAEFFVKANTPLSGVVNNVKSLLK